MADQLFPVLRGLTFSKTKYPDAGEALIQKSVSGKELRLVLQSRPRWQYDLTYEFLQAVMDAPMLGRFDNPAQLPNMGRIINSATLVENEFAVLQGFFLAQHGQAGEWLYDDINDNTVGLYQFAYGDGLRTVFFTQFKQVWQDSLASPAIIFLDDPEPGAKKLNGFAAATGVTLGSDGSITFTTTPSTLQPLYITAQNATPAGSSKLYLGEPFAGPGTTQTVDGVATIFQLTRTIGGFAQGYSEPIQNLNGSPTIWSNGVLVDPSAYSISSKGLVTFDSPPASNRILSWAGKFYFRMRFKQSANEFGQFMRNFYEAKKVECISILL